MPSELIVDILYVAGFLLTVVFGGKIYANVETQKAKIEADKERDKTRMYVDRDNMQSKLEYEVDMRGFDSEPDNSNGDMDIMSLLNSPIAQQFMQNNPQYAEAAKSFLNKQSDQTNGENK